MGRRIIGLTGGIATGKSTVSDYLATRHGLPVLDADAYARQAVQPGSPILAAIAARYGPTLLQPDGSLNRSQLGEIIFSQPAEKAWVEQQIHPFVRQRFTQITEQFPTEQTLVYAIPLLFEANLTHLVSEIWVVTCRPEQQLRRLRDRAQLSTDQAQRRIDNQLPLAEKAAQSDVVLDNSGSREALFRQVDGVLEGLGRTDQRQQRP
ncbi:dephospho-CoA kinase [Romeria aff. gracilis LEGE 07310]|uniref:Dephospho-CoA kinase n=1 Tax=Vasconcelosia minhoensis LEGE 07310 TaxID=915328 RepID=A0A8J7DPL6_9CYAN|nr:dephospho-CoA kinase [Romeria gracilis]MBE9079895.1 dephospho-CoA kinase [Romeria aff. gracilis LEGE 07310]